MEELRQFALELAEELKSQKDHIAHEFASSNNLEGWLADNEREYQEHLAKIEATVKAGGGK